MTELATTFDQTPNTGPAPAAAPVAAKPAEAPTLITEQQVLFATAAAVALPRPKARRGVLGWLMNAAAPPAPQQEPKRYVWLETALMSREMDRL
jgi:hypothetical protein